jgi:riboflavin kinase / FMN adenylyltransferase
MIRVLATIDPDPRRSTFELRQPGEPLADDPSALSRSGLRQGDEGSFAPSPRHPVAPSAFSPRAPSVVAVGKFFAVHRGHQALIGEAVARARRRGAGSVVLTFDRHPLEVLRPGMAPLFLTTLAERLALIERLGADMVVVARVTPEFLSLTPEQFVRDVLRGALDTVEIVASASFRFGKDAAGTLETLRELGATLGFAVDTLPEVLVGGERISSSRIVRELQEGRVAEAAALLGRPYSVCGAVVEGDRLGRQLGFPTANLEVSPRRVLPADGIYAVALAHAGRVHAGVAHLGPRPAVGGERRTLEAHLFDFDGDLYGKTVRLHFLHWLRGIESFPSLAALTEAIARDAARARALLPGDERSLADLAWFDNTCRLC